MIRKIPGLQSFAVAAVFAATVGVGLESSSAQQLAARADSTATGRTRQALAEACWENGRCCTDRPLLPVRRKAGSKGRGSKGPYYVDFRARTAATYGHAFIWYGKTGEKLVDVAGLHPAGDTLPYILGHLTWVPSETGASYGDLDEQYLTASYRVYLNEADAQKVFSYIKHLQATSPLWNAETTNCTNFIGQIASFMGLKTPFHLLTPEEYVNELKALNDGRQAVQLDSQ